MATQSIYDGIKHIVRVHGNFETHCEHCNYKGGYDSFTESVNHYITDHKYKLLRIGTETASLNGSTGYYSVAFLGK
jgi:hypothetical protein